MPADYNACIRKPNSKKVTKSLPEGYYIHGCKDEKGMHWGERKKAVTRYKK